MFVISVIPLKRGITLDSLTYFGSQDYPRGTIVTIPIRNSSALGLVTDSHEVSAAKTALRAATFSLRKLPAQTNTEVLSNALIRTAEELSTYYATPMGVILYNLLAPEIRNGDLPFPHTHDITHTSPPPPETLIAGRIERYRTYRSLVRETFAHSGSVLIVVPTSIDAETLRQELTGGIEDRVIMLTSVQTKTQLGRAYAELEDFSRTKLIIATPSHAMIERHDITLVIIEHARSAYYKELNRPYIDYRRALRIHARHTGRRILYGDLLLRTEEEAKRREEIYNTLGETPRRIELPGKMEVITMKRNEGSKEPFVLFSDQVISAIKETRKKKGRVFLFAARRGLAPLVACMDCGFIFRSKESGAPYSLIRTTKNGIEERWFVCGTSGERVRASDTCTACGSWRLKERGIGIQHVYDELHKVLPATPIILFDHISARTYKKATFLRDTFYKTKGAVLLGTHMAVPYLTQPIDLSIVVNMDALLATPTWRLGEENLYLLLGLREITHGPVLVQTRTPETDVLAFAKQGTVEQFYTEELALRKSFNYPPFSVFIHLTWQGTTEVVKKMEAEITASLGNFGLTVYQNPTAPVATPIMYGLIRVPPENWPDKTLGAALRTIPPSVRIIINPDRII